MRYDANEIRVDKQVFGHLTRERDDARELLRECHELFYGTVFDGHRLMVLKETIEANLNV